MSGIHIDTSEVDRLAVDLSQAPGRIQRKAPKVMQVGAYKIKQEMQSDFSGHGHLPHLGHKVNYDRRDALGLSYEIGIDKGGQGDLGNIAAYGSSNNAPVADKNAGLRKELPMIVFHLGGAAEDSVLGGAE